MSAPHITVRPIDSWTDPEPARRRSSPFSASESATMRLLQHELAAIGCTQAVIELVMDAGGLRLDGGLRASARPTHPGVALYLETRHGPLRYACATFTKHTDNLRAIALTLEALRKVDRYGTADRAEQYRGWLQIEPPRMSRSEAERVIRRAAGPAYDRAPLSRAVRAALRQSHPDGGGDEEAYARVAAARQVIEA